MGMIYCLGQFIDYQKYQNVSTIASTSHGGKSITFEFNRVRVNPLNQEVAIEYSLTFSDGENDIVYVTHPRKEIGSPISILLYFMNVYLRGDMDDMTIGTYKEFTRPYADYTPSCNRIGGLRMIGPKNDPIKLMCSVDTHNYVNIWGLPALKVSNQPKAHFSAPMDEFGCFIMKMIDFVNGFYTRYNIEESVAV